MKYLLTLFILVQVIYTQVFAHVYRGTTFNCHITTIKGSGHDQSVVLKATELEDIYVEEEEREEERVSLKEFSKDILYITLFFVPEQAYFFQRIKAHAISFSSLSNPLFLTSTHLSLQVLRI